MDDFEKTIQKNRDSEALMKKEHVEFKKEIDKIILEKFSKKAGLDEVPVSIDDLKQKMQEQFEKEIAEINNEQKKFYKETLEALRKEKE